MSLPVIDFSKLELTTPQSTSEWEHVKSQVKKAIEEYGCFMVLFDKIPLELHKSFFNELEDLHGLPLETKLRQVSEKPYNSYMVPLPGTPDAFTIDLENVDEFCNTLWPQGKPCFSKTVHSFSSRLVELEQIIKKVILEILGVENHLQEHIDNTNYVLRFLKYEVSTCNDEVAKIELGAHSDKNTMTILSQNHVDALEVQTNDGEWIDVHFSPNSFLVLFGDILHAWSNGRLRSVLHRGKVTGNKTRYSAGLFSSFRPGYIVKAPDELVDQEHPLLFKPFDYTEFLKFFVTYHDKSYLAGLKKYCAV